MGSVLKIAGLSAALAAALVASLESGKAPGPSSRGDRHPPADLSGPASAPLPSRGEGPIRVIAIN